MMLRSYWSKMNVSGMFYMSILLFYNAFVLNLIFKFDSEVDEMLQQHSKTFHLIISLLVAIEKSYVLYKMSQWQNYYLILEVPRD